MCCSLLPSFYGVPAFVSILKQGLLPKKKKWGVGVHPAQKKRGGRWLTIANGGGGESAGSGQYQGSSAAVGLGPQTGAAMLHSGCAEMVFRPGNG